MQKRLQLLLRRPPVLGAGDDPCGPVLFGQGLHADVRGDHRRQRQGLRWQVHVQRLVAFSHRQHEIAAGARADVITKLIQHGAHLAGL